MIRLLALLLLALAPQVAAQPFPDVWGTVGAGGSENGGHGSFELSISGASSPATVTVQYVEGNQFLSDAPFKKHHLYSILLGVRTSERLLTGRFLVGLGYIDGIEHVGWSRDKLDHCFIGCSGDFEERPFAHVNIPLRMEGLFHPFGNGIGSNLYVQANLNPTRSFVSFGLAVSLGKFRSL